ncbi:hypothetical protein [Haloprofundus salilacus]|uniref:hypothetical protein n=1 Tax=Haloprofundus salilacus TaxID=2876190 RepID=UPI001CCE280C|nr:hypothetical protein [Haloprofundus salilacus]
MSPPTDEPRPTSSDTGPDGRGPTPTNGSTQSARSTGSTTESVRRVLDKYLPHRSVDSSWWYWIAAVPALFVVSLGFGVGAFFLALLGVGLDIAGFMGLATAGFGLFFFLVASVLALASLVVAVLFPVAMYVDARAVEEADLGWNPDPVLYFLGAVLAVVATNFLLSVPLSVYYLYKRHEAIGRP